MKNKTFWISRNAFFVLALVVFGGVLSSASAEKDQESRYLEDLKKARQELTDVRGALTNLKSLYAEKEIQSRELKLKLDKVNDNLRHCQESATQLSKDKEILANQQNKLSVQLKQSETEKFISQQQNQIMASSSKENEAKTRELFALRNSCAQEKKDLLSKIQNI
jgi:hypothetical protein